MLLDDPGRAGAGVAGRDRIVVLQPRRVAARAVAARVAWERRCPLGAEVGYQIRFDDRTSLGTRICFVTEGILLRWLQDDPELSDIAILIFDEFFSVTKSHHELRAFDDFLSIFPLKFIPLIKTPNQLAIKLLGPLP